MTVFEQIKQKLLEEQVDFITKEHPNEPHASEAAVGFDPDSAPHHEGAKAIVVKGKKSEDFYLFVLPDDLKLDQKKVKDVLGERWSFAEYQEVIDVTKCIPGSVPPFGSVIGLRTMIDKKFEEEKDVFFNAGSLTHSNRMSYHDYFRAEKPLVVDVT